MRWYSIFVVGLLALMLHEQSLLAQIAPLPQNNSVKLRLEIEIQGVLSVTEKSVTITNKERVFELVKDPNDGQVVTANGWARVRKVDKVWVLELDENLKNTAKTLHGKEVVLTGKCLLLGVKSQADTVKTPDLPVIVPGGFATSVQSQLLLDERVTVISLKAAK
jgi:hypothetical protein